MDEEQRITFYRYAAALSRRRRRTIAIYVPSDVYSSRRETMIRVTNGNASVFEEYYNEYNNIEPYDPTKLYIDEKTKKFGREIITGYYQENKEYMQVIDKSRKREVVYEDENGNKYIKRGGSPAWRHNNPGNLSFSSLAAAKKTGAIDIVEEVDRNGHLHRWGVYASREDGERALREKLRERRFSYEPNGQKRNIASMIAKVYAPAEDSNDPRSYAKFVQQTSGIDVFRKSVQDLTDEEFDALVNSIKAKEGTIRGEYLKVIPKQK